MLVYNVTMKIDREAEEEWLQWMKQKHIPDVMATELFISSSICKLLDQPEEDEGTYVIQYRCEDRNKFDRYINQFAAKLRGEYNERYKDRFAAFRTLMEEV